MDELQDKPKTRSERHHKTLNQKFKKWFIRVGIIFVIFLIALTTIVYGGKLIVKDKEIVLPATSTIETEDGELLWELYEEYRKPVSLESVPLHVQNAFIAIEDRRFYSHGGVDFKSIIRAVYRDVLARSKVEGASTITQQLAKNLFLTNEKTWLRKTKEVMVSIYMEREFEKEEILELYINTIYFGQGVYGIGAASERFFSKQVDELSLEEGALLAGLAKAPNSYSPVEYPEKAKERRNVVLHVMGEMDMISKAEQKKAQESSVQLQITERKKHPSIDSYIDLVLKEMAEKYDLTIDQVKRGGYRIIVAMNPMFQKIAFESMQESNYFPGNNPGVEGAFVLTDHRSGRIVSVIGGRNYQFGDLNRINVKRQPGSAFKPIAVYGPAMMNGAYNPYTLIPDQLIDWNGYKAKNYDGKYAGSVSLMDAVTYSKNAPAVWLLQNIGVDYAKEYLQKMNITFEDSGLAIALGGLKEGVTPLQLSDAYQTFARGGSYIEGHTVLQIYSRTNELIAQAEPKTSNVFTEQVAWNMTEMLQQVVGTGTARKGVYKKELAGKTGSTEHPYAEGYYKDAWFAGYTPEYAFACWVGYDYSDKDHYLTTGSTAPVRLMKEILSEMDNQRSLQAGFIKPDGIKAVESPIKLSKVTNVKATYIFGGLSIVQGKLTWEAASDNRVVYRIYKVKKGIDERIGEVSGKTEFIVENVSLFNKSQYYIVPYDPLTKLEGPQSDFVVMTR
ncbi:PBP1A family penicillin-binding protein [Virgibacillus sp. W0430]|uniref:transglycosylase domain-containing protein n=1 Tax=Virgibacillus sp. W0430 TaxID=3391580 RepID=UPI003F47BBEF